MFAMNFRCYNQKCKRLLKFVCFIHRSVYIITAPKVSDASVFRINKPLYTYTPCRNCDVCKNVTVLLLTTTLSF